MKKLLLAGALALVLLVALQSPSVAGVIINCAPDVRGCSENCCFICYLSSASINADMTYYCNYNDCSFFCTYS